MGIRQPVVVDGYRKRKVDDFPGYFKLTGSFKLAVFLRRSIETKNVTVSWESLAGAASYKWQVDTDADFSGIPSGFEGQLPRPPLIYHHWTRGLPITGGSRLSLRYRVSGLLTVFYHCLERQCYCSRFIQSRSGSTVSLTPVFQWDNWPELKNTSWLSLRIPL